MKAVSGKSINENEQLEQYLIRISSDITLARSALHYCYATISPRDCGQFGNCISTLRHFATTAMAIHLYRVFEFQKPHRKSSAFIQPSFSIVSLADYLLIAKIETTVHDFYNLLGYTNDYDDKCTTCVHDIAHHMNEECLYCLPIRLANITKARCNEATSLITRVKKFRNKWVAHTEMPTETIPTTYSDFERLTSLAEDLLFPFTRYFQVNPYHYETVEQQQAFRFTAELEKLFTLLSKNKE